jgi:hypothetical protein
MAAMSGAMAGIAASQAAAASAAAHRAEVSRCKLVVDNFDNNTANVTEMRDYASCVNTLYPEPMSSDMETAAKVLFVVAILGAIYGLYVAYKDGKYWNNTCGDYVLSAILWFFAFPLVLAMAGGFVCGVVWLFS